MKKKKTVNYISLQIWCGLLAFLSAGLLIFFSNLKIIHIGKYKSEQDYIKFNINYTFELQIIIDSSSIIYDNNTTIVFNGNYSISNDTIILTLNTEDDNYQYFFNYMSHNFKSDNFSTIKMGSNEYINYFAKCLYVFILVLLVASLVGFCVSFLPYFSAINNLIKQKENGNGESQSVNKIKSYEHEENKNRTYNSSFLKKTDSETETKKKD